MMNITEMTVIMMISTLMGIGLWATINHLLFAPVKEKNMSSVNGTGMIRTMATQILKTALDNWRMRSDSSISLENILSDERVLQKLYPEIDRHVDQFLNEKLQTIFPLLFKFMGDKTLAQFKDAFTTEVELLLPVIIRKYFETLKQDPEIDNLVIMQLQGNTGHQLTAQIQKSSKKYLDYFRLLCIGFGVLSGLSIILALSLVK